MEENVFALWKAKGQKEELALLESCNERSRSYGLVLTEEDARELMACRDDSLKRHRRVELGGGILDRLIDAFCDCAYITQDSYLETLERLLDIFYSFKNESMEKLTDGELLHFMREQYERICFGDLDYLEDTCLERFARAIRFGYEGYQSTEGIGEYDQFDEEERWDEELYQQILKEIFW